MNLVDLLRTLAPFPVVAPPQSWVAEFEVGSATRLFRTLLRSVSIQPPVADESHWTLANLVVRADPGEPELIWPKPGEHVAITLTAPGACDADWRWPDPFGTHPAPASVLDLLEDAAVAFAYGRVEEGGASVTIAFPCSTKPSPSV